MKTLKFLVLFLSVPVAIQAHDGGHGPKLTDVGKHGGVVTAVVAAEDRKLGPKAKLIYKAELLRMADRTIRFFIYDKNMNPLDMGKFDASAKGLIETEKKKKVKEQPFKLSLNPKCAAKKACFMGKTPKPARKPFNIDIRFKEKGTELLAAFDSLD